MNRSLGDQLELTQTKLRRLEAETTERETEWAREKRVGRIIYASMALGSQGEAVNSYHLIKDDGCEIDWFSPIVFHVSHIVIHSDCPGSFIIIIIIHFL